MEMIMVKPEPAVFHIRGDYGVKEAKKLGLFEWREPFVKEYAKEGFPKWKRLNFSQISLEEPKTYKGRFLNGNAKITETFTEAVEREHFGKFPPIHHNGAHKKFTLMSHAFFNTGFFIKSFGKDEVHAHYAFDSNPVIIENSLVIVKGGSTLTLIREITGKGKLRVSNTIFLVEEGAKLNFFNVFIAPKTSLSVDSNSYIIDKDAQVKTYDVVLGGDRVATNHEFKLIGINAEANIYSFYFESGQERADLEYKLIHEAPKTVGYLNGNGVVKNKSYVVFRGNIQIPFESYGVKAKEKSHSINLSPNARVDAIPYLSVRNHSVTAEHAASMGSLDEKKLYYMMSRGLDKHTAMKLILQGTFKPLIDAIPNKSVKRDVEDELFKRI